LRYHDYDGSYPGLEKRLAEATETNAAMHIVVVHGIGIHAPGYATTLGDGLARQLNLAPLTNSPAMPLVSSKGVTNWIRDFSYENKNRKVIFHEVTWSPTTSSIKTNAFATDQKLDAHRVRINKAFKNQLMDSALSDALLYMNPTFRGTMQEPILQAIEQVAQETGSNDPIVLIASSLGSKMTFDTALAYERNAKVQHFTERTTDIIMLANQLPLLHLGTATDFEKEQLQGRDTVAKQFLQKSRDDKETRANRERWRATRREATIHVVAATDPNDLLSYPLSRRDIVPDDENAGGVRISMSNIYSHNARAILFVFENPAAAHENYDQNTWLLKKLVRGYTSSPR